MESSEVNQIQLEDVKSEMPAKVPAQLEQSSNKLQCNKQTNDESCSSSSIAFEHQALISKNNVKESCTKEEEPIVHSSDIAKSPANSNKQATSNNNKRRSSRRRTTDSGAKKQKMYETEDIIREISPGRFVGDENDGDASRGAQNENASVEKVLVVIEKPGCSKTGQPSTFTKATVQCNICKKVMVESRLANHIRLLHVESSQENDDQKKKDFRCEHCGKLYATRYIYVQHLRNHEEGRPKCPECGSTFASAFTLFRHRVKTHNIEHHYTTYSCTQCDKNFFSSSELKLHQQRHSDQKDFKCNECEKEFAVKGNLRIHMRTHAKTKLYKCDICDNSFSHPYSLTSHRRIHTNNFPFKCNECDKACRSRHQLTSHKNVHSDLRPFQCNQCTKAFKSRTAFKTHQDEHQGIKRFVCQFCARQFQCYGNKLKHERRHIGDKKHKCSECPKGFIEKQELRNHMKIHDKSPGSKKEDDITTVPNDNSVEASTSNNLDKQNIQESTNSDISMTEKSVIDGVEPKIDAQTSIQA